jgi:hypothetical protein
MRGGACGGMGGGDMGGGMGGGRRAGRGRCVPPRKVRALPAASSRAKVQAKGVTRKSADATHAQSAPRASGERDAPWLLRATAVRAGRTGAPDEGCNQTQSDAIRRNQTQSDAISMPGALLFSVFSCFGRAARACVLCFCVLGRHNGPVCVVVVFGRHNGSTGLCFVFSCFGRPPFTSLKTQHGVNFLPYKT